MTNTSIQALLANLNPQQRDAAVRGDEPLLIVAGAGAGKTTTLSHRTAHLVAQGANPSRILLLTFSRQAATELIRRVESILQPLAASRAGILAVDVKQIWGGTFHATAARLLRIHGPAVGLDPGFTIYDRADAEDLLNVLRVDLGLASRERRFPTKTTCIAIYSRCINAGESLDVVLDRLAPGSRSDATDLKRLFAAYVGAKEQRGVVDFDDLLVYWRALLEAPGAGDAVRARFDHVLVDEYQDTNALQAAILRGLRPDGRGLSVVGDDAQAIYSFRAATVRNILDFEKHHPGAAVVKLEVNYRATPPLVTATNAVIAEAAERHDKKLVAARTGGSRPVFVTCRDEDEQTDVVVRAIVEQHEKGIPLREQAVLFRASHHSVALELELRRRNVPFRKFGGLKLVEARHVKDLASFLRMAESPRDTIAATRVLLLLPGVGPVTARQLTEKLVMSGLGAWERITHSPTKPPELWRRLVELVQVLARVSPVTALSLGEQVHRVREFWAELVEGHIDNFEGRMRDLEQLEHLAGRYPDRAAFLADLALDPPSATQELAGPSVAEDDYLVLSTIHSAKGLEFACVYVIHAADGNIPSDRAVGSIEEIDEERRLFYVALTRARDHLTVTFPLHVERPRRPFEAYQLAQRSRFLTERVLRHFEQRVAGGAGDEAEALRAAPPAVVDVRARMRQWWT